MKDRDGTNDRDGTDDRDGIAAAKRRAGERAAELIVEEYAGADDLVLGLGTGSTAAAAIAAIGRVVADGLADVEHRPDGKSRPDDNGLSVQGIPTSHQSRRVALEAGIPLTTLGATGGIDVAVDGADQVVLTGPPGERTGAVLVKGGGAAHVREKVIAAAADRFLVVVDESKLSETLDHPIPVAVLPDARSLAEDRIRESGGEATLRAAAAKDGPVVTDDGALVLDVDFGSIEDPVELAARLSEIPGVLDHGLFVDLADAVIVGTDTGVHVEEC